MINLPPFYNMTSVQRETMIFISERIQAGQSPTLEEIAVKTGRFVQNVHKTVKRLEELGFISRDKNVARGITLAEKKS